MDVRSILATKGDHVALIRTDATVSEALEELTSLIDGMTGGWFRQQLGR